MTREYTDKGYVLESFRDEVWCKCPSCNELAIVRGSKGFGPVWGDQNATIACTRCAFTKRFAWESWLGEVVGFARRRCKFDDVKRSHRMMRNQWVGAAAGLAAPEVALSARAVCYE